MNVDGRVALITGGKRIGAVVATELARAGADVALVYNHSKAEAEETARALALSGNARLSFRRTCGTRMPVSASSMPPSMASVGSTSSSTWRRSIARCRSMS